MSFIEAMRKRAEETETGVSFFQWWDQNEGEIVELCMSAFLAGCGYNYEQINKALAKEK